MSSRPTRIAGSYLSLSRRLASLHKRDRAQFRKEAERRGLSRRRAYYLLRIGQDLQSGRVELKDAKLIGWTKLGLILDKMNARNAARLTRLAKTGSVEELKHALHSGGKRTRLRCVQLYFSPSQYEVFSRALLHHGALRAGRGLKGQEAALLKAISTRKTRSAPRRR